MAEGNPAGAVCAVVTFKYPKIKIIKDAYTIFELSTFALIPGAKILLLYSIIILYNLYSIHKKFGNTDETKTENEKKSTNQASIGADGHSRTNPGRPIWTTDENLSPGRPSVDGK